MVGWGDQQYGLQPWGLGDATPGEIVGVSPGIVSLRGGTLLTVIGNGFVAPIELLVTRGPLGSEIEIGEGFMWDSTYDLTFTTAVFGLPRSDQEGAHNIQLVISGTPGATFYDAIEYKLHAEKYKVHKIRKSFAPIWRTGPRLLSDAIAGGVG